MLLKIVLSATTVAVALTGCGGASSSGTSTTSPAGEPGTAPVRVQSLQESGVGNKLLKVQPFSEMAVDTFSCVHSAGNAGNYEGLPHLNAVDQNGVQFYAIHINNSDSMPYSGTVLVPTDTGNRAKPPFVAYDIQCPGAWTLKQGPATDAKTLNPGSTMSGIGADVLQVPVNTSGLHTIHLTTKTAQGAVNLQVKAYTAQGKENGSPLIQLTAAYDGDVVIPANTAIIKLEGFENTDWTIKSE